MGARFFIKCIAAALLIPIAAHSAAKTPNCANKDAWPSGMAYTHLKNAGLISALEFDPNKTTVTRLSSEKIGRNLYLQIHLVNFRMKAGEQLSAITVNQVSQEECSMSGVDVYVVSKKIGDYTQ